MEAPARPPPFLHLGGGTRGSEGDDHRATGIDPNIVKRIREKTVHLRQRMATSTAAQAQSQHLDVLRHDWERRTRTYKEREERYTSEIRELEDAIVAFHAQRLRPESLDERDPMQPVGVYHRDIVNSLRELEGRSAAIKVERNRDLTRAHRARLLDWSKAVWKTTTGLGGLGYLQTPLPRSNRTRFP